MRERRRSPRVDFELKLTLYSDKKYKNPVSRHCYVTNVSKTGLRFMSSESYAPGDNFFMKLELIDNYPVFFHGEIYWKKGFNALLKSYGVKFSKMDMINSSNLENKFFSKFFHRQKSGTQQALEYTLLILLVIMLARFLNSLPLIYTVGIFAVFLVTFYYALLRK